MSHRQERLQPARVRLSSSDWAAFSIGQIADSFSTAFREGVAVTPRQVRGGELCGPS